MVLLTKHLRHMTLCSLVDRAFIDTYHFLGVKLSAHTVRGGDWGWGKPPRLRAVPFHSYQVKVLGLYPRSDNS